MFFKKKQYEDYVDLSIGRVYIRPLTNSAYAKAFKKSSVIKNQISNAHFLEYCEKYMTCLPFWKWGSLTIPDGDKLRAKIIAILKTYPGIFEEEKEEVKDDTPNFELSAQDQEWFKNQATRQKGLVGGR